MPTVKEKRLAEASKKKVDALIKNLTVKSAAQARIVAATVRISEARAALNSAMKALSTIVDTSGDVQGLYRELRDVEVKLKGVEFSVESCEDSPTVQLDRNEPDAKYEREWLTIAAPFL